MSDKFFEEIIQDFQDTVYLENTRRQYDFIEQLATEFGKYKNVNDKNRDDIFCKDNLFGEVYKFIKGEIEKIDKSGFSSYQNSICKYMLNQNSNSIFNLGIIGGRIKYQKIASLVTYFSLVRYYESIIDKEHLHDNNKIIDRSDFDRITESIRRILNVDICHIISLKDGTSTILSSSNERFYYSNSKKENKENEKLLAFSKLISFGIAPIPNDCRSKNVRTLEGIIKQQSVNSAEERDKDELWLVDNTIAISTIPYNEDSNMRVLIIKISPNGVANETYLVALLKVDWDQIKDKRKYLLKISAEIVFLKSKLWRLIDFCYESLYNSQMHYDYVPRINKSEGGKSIVYHISDLHVNSESFESKKRLLKRCMSEMKNDKEHPLETPDILLITGDICDCGSTAQVLESNYDKAAQIIKCFVSYFWCTEGDNIKGGVFLRSDWKKRIVFCPGNHDYASMNELQSTSSQRETISGNSIETASGSTVAKFAYYINAMRKHFNVVETHIDDKLNFVRCFPKIGINVVSLNSCSESNSHLQNKAHVDFDEALKMKNKLDNIENFEGKVRRQYFQTIVMSHHSCNYYPNYFGDRYPRYYGKEREKKKLYKVMVANVLAILLYLKYSDESSVMVAFRNKVFNFYREAYQLQNDEYENIENLYNKAGSESGIKNIIGEIKSIAAKYNDKEFIKLYNMIREIIENRFYVQKRDFGAIGSPEYSKVLLRLNRICSDIEESIADFDVLRKVGEIFEPEIHWLSGHVHEDANPNVQGQTNEDTKKIIHEAKQFFNMKGRDLNVYKIDYNREKKSQYSILKSPNLETLKKKSIEADYDKTYNKE